MKRWYCPQWCHRLQGWTDLPSFAALSQKPADQAAKAYADKHKVVTRVIRKPKGWAPPKAMPAQSEAIPEADEADEEVPADEAKPNSRYALACSWAAVLGDLMLENECGLSFVADPNSAHLCFQQPYNRKVVLRNLQDWVGVERVLLNATLNSSDEVIKTFWTAYMEMEQ